MKPKKASIEILLIASILTFGFYDSYGQTAEVVKIGNQEWMAKNLDVSTFRNGDLIPEAKKGKEWETAGNDGKPAWCYFDNDPENGEKYGKLYNWYAVNDPRGIAPTGWHVPSDAEWTQLTDDLGGEDIAGTLMKSREGWKKKGNGTNESGFNAVPAGGRYDDGTFSSLKEYTYWWSATETDSSLAWYRYTGFEDDLAPRYYYDKRTGFSVRCLKDK